MTYEHEQTGDARMGSGETAPNPAQEVVQFDTIFLGLRYGISSRINLVAVLPWYSIQSDKVQGQPYLRTNSGIGDLLLEADFQVLTSPQLSLSAGLEFPTGSVDNTDQYGQRICDILALGSGTTDAVLGANIWVPNAVIKKLDLVAGGRHRFSGGANKWSYRFGAETDFWAHASYALPGKVRLGARFDGFHTESDTWYGNVVPERGATVLYLGPTVAWKALPNVVVGGFAKVPVWMDLVGSQMMAPVVFGFDLTTDLTSGVRRIRGGGEE
jgi:hypothetical protein